jgi:hypothetical protein
LALVRRVHKEIVGNLILEYLTPDKQKAWLQIYSKIYDYCQSKRFSLSMTMLMIDKAKQRLKRPGVDSMHAGFVHLIVRRSFFSTEGSNPSLTATDFRCLIVNV